MSSKIKSAVVAGVLLGVALSVIAIVSALSPALGLLGCCACLLPIGAGVYAVQGYVSKSPAPVQIGDGAVMGAVAGAVGGVIYLIVGAPLAYLINAASLEAQMAQMRQAGIDIPLAGFAFVIVGGIIGIVVDAILGLIGGIIGVPLFEKRKGGSVPPPPPPGGGFDGPAGGGSFGQGV